jgi:multimeric flavodoxin WrbA
MKILVLGGSPNRDGLTAACVRAAMEGAVRGGAAVQEIRLHGAGIGLCHACGNGWGPCRTEHRCQVEDGFQETHAACAAADGIVLVTPVYWGDMSEAVKAFTDRLRRCEASAGEKSRMAGKPVLAVAAAGGTGGGLVSCLGNMERLIQHLKARQFDLVSVNRWNREYKLRAIGDSAAAMAGASTNPA